MVEGETKSEGQKTAEDNDVFGRRVALMTAIFGILLAFSSVGGSNADKAVLLGQQRASDQWAFYQGKAIREHVYRVPRLMLEAQIAEPTNVGAAERERLQGVLAKLAEEEKRYGTEKKDIEAEAKKTEQERDLSERRGDQFDLAGVFLQIAIVASSVAILAHSRPIFYFSCVFALVGALYTLNGFTLKVPFLG